MTAAPTRLRGRALAHQCAACRRHFALRVVEHPAGNVVLCRHCGALRSRVTALVGDGSDADLETIGAAPSAPPAPLLRALSGVG